MTRVEEISSKVFQPNTAEDLEVMAQAKADAHEGKAPRSNHPLYIDTYSMEKSLRMIQEAE